MILQQEFSAYRAIGDLRFEKILRPSEESNSRSHR
jgi:hypothetical protein